MDSAAFQLPSAFLCSVDDHEEQHFGTAAAGRKIGPVGACGMVHTPRFNGKQE